MHEVVVGDECAEGIGHDCFAGANMGNQFIRCGALGCCILQVAKPQARVPVEASAVRKKKVMFIPAGNIHRLASRFAYQLAGTFLARQPPAVLTMDVVVGFGGGPCRPS